MSNVVSFNGGKRCIECDEQIDPKRLRVQPDAKKCTKCQENREQEVLSSLKVLNQISPTKRERASVVFRW